MKNSFRNAVIRVLTVMLCAVMVMTTFSLPVSAVTADVAQMSAGNSSQKEYFEQVGASLESAEEFITMSNRTDDAGSTPVQTVTKNYVYVKTDTPRYNNRYIILHEATGNLMSYKAYEPENPASSIVYNQDGNGDNMYYFATDAEGNVDKSKLYIDHSDRDEALWLVRQDKNASYGTDDIQTDDVLSNDTDVNVEGVANPFLDGVTRYHHAFLYKGLGPVWNANGTIDTDVPQNGAYWYSVTGMDVDEGGTQERFLRLYVDDMYGDGTSTVNTQLELQDDGTFLVYRRVKPSGQPATFYMLTCDSDGVWKTVAIQNLDGTTAETTRDNYKLSFYRYTSDSGFKTVNFKGYQTYDVLAGTTKEQVLGTIAQNITVMNITNKNMTIPFSGDTGKVGYYYIDFSADFDSSAQRTQSSYNAVIKYRNDDGTDTVVGSLSVRVHDEIAIKGTASITNLAGTVPQNTTEGYIVQNIVNDQNTDCTFTVQVKTAQGVQTKTVPVTIGMLTDSNGKAVSTVNNGVTEDLTLTYMGEVVTNNFTLTVDDSDEALNYPVYPEEGSVTVTKTGTAVGKFNETGVANINLSTTGIPQNKGVDMIVVMDLSGSMSYGVTNTVRVNETNLETSRIYALQESLRAMIATLKASDVDYRIAMSDFGDIDSYEFDKAVVDKTNPDKFFFDGDVDGYWDQKYTWALGARREFYNHLNYVHGTYGEDYTDESGNKVDLDNQAMPYNVFDRKYEKAYPTYTGRIIPNIYTGSHTVGAEAFVNVDTFDDSAVESLLNEVAIHQKNSLGTNYDIGLEYAYQLGYAIQQENISKGLDRDIICVFMSDGAAMQYNYFSGRAVNQSWADWLRGDIEFDKFQHNAPSDPSASPELVSVMNALLTKLQKGNLENPKYRVKEHLMNTSGEVNPNNASGEVAPKEVTENTTTKYYFDFSEEDIAAISNETTFYSAMSKLNIDIYWELMCRIADANGLKEYATAADIDADLLALAKANNLIYPTDQTQYYPQYTGTATDFFTAMSELGINCNWELFVQIATQNISDGRLDTIYTELTTLAEGKEWGTLSPYYYFYNEEGKNWYAEAIKGSRAELYPVVNKYAFSNNSEDTFAYYGDVRNNFSTDTGLELDGKDYISGFRGLDIPIYTVGLSLCTENYLTEDIAKNVLANISSGPSYAFTANNKEELIDVFNTIGTSSAVAATGSYFVDKMGPEFDLYTRKTVTNENGETVTINVEPKIRVLEYKLDANHERTGAPIVYETVTISEDLQGNLIVTSDKIYNTVEDSDGNLSQVYPNILQSDGIIKAKYFYYNTNKYVDENNTGVVRIDLTGDGVGDWNLDAETFFWIIGPIGNTEMVLDYQVYLTGAMEGERDLGVYETNTSAKLGYVNYLGNNCSKDTVSPAFPWPSPFAGYAFYLVDENGNPLNANGDPSTFTDSYKIANPQYIEMLLNGAANVITPDGLITEEMSLFYDLYDPAAKYEVAVNSDDTGYWNITKSDGLGSTTYVTNYGGAPTTKDSSELTSEAAYDRTVVWFALKVVNMTNPDTVVIDYGLPVNVDVLANDAINSEKYTLEFVENGSAFDNELAAAKQNDSNITLDKYLGSVPVTETAKFSTTEAQGTYGKAVVADNQISYTLNTTNGMQMSEEEVFAYAAYHEGTGSAKSGKGYHYSTLTVIPATSIYYEDNFVSFNVYDHDTGTAVTEDTPHYDDLKWTDAGTTLQKVQAQDRPGEYPLAGLDAGNVYGYDEAYADNMNLYSMGSSKLINVGNHTFADGTTAKTRATANFTFKGTGFDIVSLTSNTTGTIVIQVAGKDDVKNVNKFFMVDTYYGYAYDLCEVSYIYEKGQWKKSVGEKAADGVLENKAVMPENPVEGQVVTGVEYVWIVDTDAENALYQIPVMKIEDLPYGKYDVTITVAYAPLFDHEQYGDAQNFDFYLDAIRIYDPANYGANSDVIKDAYIADNEGWPKYEEVRNLILKAESFGSAQDNQVVNGAVFIDNTEADPQTGEATPTITDYLNFGPNNEVYLAPGQAIAFELDGTNIDKALIAMKSISGNGTDVKIFAADTNVADAEVKVINTATDLYYDITSLAGKVVVIYNCSDSSEDLLSVTNIRTTYSSDPGTEVSVADNVKMSDEYAAVALKAFEPKPVEETTTEATPDETTADEQETTAAETETSSQATETTEVTTTDTTETVTSAPAEDTTVTDNTEATTQPENNTESTTDNTVEDLVLRGDANQDKTVNIKDATEIQKHAAQLLTLEGDALKAADFDTDGNVNIKDATGIQKFIAGLF